MYDVFISHASEDKDIAGPLAKILRRRGYAVWYDEYVLRLGDSLRREIERGLTDCRYGVVILSPHFFAKEWPQRELDGLAEREVDAHTKVVLPIWHQVDHSVVVRYSPILASKVGVRTSEGLPVVANQIAEVLGNPIPKTENRNTFSLTPVPPGAWQRGKWGYSGDSDSDYWAIPGLKYCRRERGLSRQELADLLGATLRDIVEIEQHHFIHKIGARLVAEALGVSMEDLLASPTEVDDP